MEKERKVSQIMDLCLANDWSPARITKLVQIISKERGHKLTYTKANVTAHVNWRKNHPLKNKPEVTPETVKADQEALKKFAELASEEVVDSTAKEITKEPSNKPEKKEETKATTKKTVKA